MSLRSGALAVAWDRQRQSLQHAVQQPGVLAATSPHPGMGMSQPRCHGNPSAGFFFAVLLYASGSPSPVQRNQDGCLHDVVLGLGSNQSHTHHVRGSKEPKALPFPPFSAAASSLHTNTLSTITLPIFPYLHCKRTAGTYPSVIAVCTLHFPRKVFNLSL